MSYRSCRWSCLLIKAFFLLTSMNHSWINLSSSTLSLPTRENQLVMFLLFLSYSGIMLFHYEYFKIIYLISTIQMVVLKLNCFYKFCYYCHPEFECAYHSLCTICSEIILPVSSNCLSFLSTTPALLSIWLCSASRASIWLSTYWLGSWIHSYMHKQAQLTKTDS